jgi:hypothetical protein
MSNRETFEQFNERCADDGDLYRRLVDMRGGCVCCFVYPPCTRCSFPMTEREATLLGWEPPEPVIDYMAEVRRLCR